MRLTTMDHKTIGHYEVVRLLGEGGMGRVFLARDTMLDREVALKVLSSANPLSEEVARFEREALASLNHPNILSIHEFGRVGTRQFFVMDLLDGRNVRELLAAGPIPHRTVIRHALEIAYVPLVSSFTRPLYGRNDRVAPLRHSVIPSVRRALAPQVR